MPASLQASKKSKHVYTQHQLIAIHALIKYTKSYYRDIVDLIEAMDSIKDVLYLDQLPYFTTIQKFVQRFGESKLDYLITVQTKRISELSGNCCLNIKIKNRFTAKSWIEFFISITDSYCPAFLYDSTYRIKPFVIICPCL